MPAKNVAELLALARAKPGTLNFGSSGPGSNYHMAAELLKSLTGIDIVHVPYKGSTGMRTDILSGQIQMLFDSMPTMAPTDQGRHGARARHQRQARARRSCPTCRPSPKPACPAFRRHSGSASWRRKATPQPIVDQLNRTITDILKRPDIKDAWEKQGATPMVMTQAVVHRLHGVGNRQMG